jgi:hypothetical protein
LGSNYTTANHDEYSGQKDAACSNTAVEKFQVTADMFKSSINEEPEDGYEGPKVWG